MKQHKKLVLTGVTAAIVIYLLLAFIFSALPQNTYYKLAESPIPDKGQRVLVFTPHPDDESIAVGGYIYSAHEAGADVEVILATDGNHMGLRDKRYQEFRAATGKLQVPPGALQFWGYPDSKLSDYFNELEPQVEKEIELYQPTYVIYPHPQDRHPDHSALGRAVEAALAHEGAAGENIKAYAYLIHFKYYPEPQILTRRHYLMPPVAVADHNEIWNKVTLTPEAENAKNEAISQYKSQLRNPFLFPLIRGLMRNNELIVSRDIQPVQQI